MEEAAGSAAAAAVSAAEAHDRVGSTMRTGEFLGKLEHHLILTGIREAESKTSGEIRVHIQRGKLNVDPLIAVEKKFNRLRMHQALKSNSVLIFVQPRAHQLFAVVDNMLH